MKEMSLFQAVSVTVFNHIWSICRVVVLSDCFLIKI